MRSWDEGSPESELVRATTAELQAELARRQARLQALQASRSELLERVAEIDREIRAIQHPGASGTASGEVGDSGASLPLPRRWEAFDSLPLPEALTRLMAIGEVITPNEATERLIAKGYGVRSKSLRTRVTQVLAGESRFKRVARGRYERCA